MAEEKKADFSAGEVGKELGITAGGIAVFELLRKAWGLMKVGSRTAAAEVIREVGSKAAAETAKKVQAKMSDHYRAKLLVFLQKMESSTEPRQQSAAKTIRKRQEDRQFCRPRSYSDGGNYRPGEENLLVNCLGKVLILKEPEKEVAAEAAATEKETINFFVWLGELPPQEFDSAIEFLNHDIVMQWLRMLGIRFNEIFGIVGSELRPFNDKWVKWLNNRRTARGRRTVEYQKEGPPHA